MSSVPVSNAGAPAVMKLLAHDMRWQALEVLARSDYRVHELVEILGQPFNLVSYHLRKMREAQIVVERRSSADARDVYYTINVGRLHDLYFDAAESLHPALRESTGNGALAQDARYADSPGVDEAKDLPLVRVLFLCTHNSARSQMAEGIMRHLGGENIEVYSAGSQPGTVHPDAVRVMHSIGIDISGHCSKSMERYVGQSFDYIITVCDRVREVCPLFPGDPEHMHWSFADPAEVEGEAARLRAFQHTAQELMTRIRYVLLLIEADRKRRLGAPRTTAGSAPHTRAEGGTE